MHRATQERAAAAEAQLAESAAAHRRLQVRVAVGRCMGRVPIRSPPPPVQATTRSLQEQLAYAEAQRDTAEAQLGQAESRAAHSDAQRLRAEAQVCLLPPCCYCCYPDS